MVRLVVVLFLFAHGALHPLVFATHPKADAPAPPFDPHRSWALHAAHAAPRVEHSASVWFSWGAGALLVFAAAALAFGSSAWVAAAAAGAAVGLVLKIGWFHPWLSFGVALDVATLVALSTGFPGSLY